MKTTSTTRAIALLSGGLDSTAALVLSQSKMTVLRAITFDYGQRAAEREVAASRRVAEYYGIAHEVIELPWLASRLPEAMAAGGNWRGLPARSARTANRVWVPNRNGVFLNIAASLAEAEDAQVVLYGANLDEAEGFPDNTEAYRQRLNEALALSTRNGVRVESPVGHLTKRAIVGRLRDRGMPLELIWSCYEGESLHCGRCPSCQFLKEALGEKAEVVFQA